MDPWQLARNRYMEDLNEEEKKTFETASLGNLFYGASAMQKEHEEKSVSRAVSQRLEPFISAIDQYSKALDVFANIHPLVMAPLWGSIRPDSMSNGYRHQIARSFEKYFKKLVDMFTRIGDILPRCQIYFSLFPSHERLLQAISVVYFDVINFCINAKATFRKLKKSTTRHFTLKSLWKDFNAEFEETLDKFRNHVKDMEKQAGISNLIESSSERALARADRAEMERQRKIARRDSLLSKLSSFKYIDKHLKERKKRHPGTGSWLLETDEFKDWISGNRSACLWCYGIPGSGKTVLASSLIDTLSVDTTGEDITIPRFTSRDIIDKSIVSHETSIGYHYCDFSDSKSLGTQAILGTIIRQLLENIVIPDDLEQKIDQSYRLNTRTASDDELASILYAVVNLFSIVYICIDGLDECGKDEQATILSAVDKLSRSDQATVKTFITSRQEPPIHSPPRVPHRLEVSADETSLDIRAFVEETVKFKIRSGALTIRDHSLESDIISALINGAEGMFLWVHFQLIDLCETRSDFGIREALRSLPRGMARTYARVLRKIEESQPNLVLAQRIFKWVICAKRPLLITELGEAIAFGPSDRCWNVEKIPNTSNLIQACRSLAVLDDDNTVRLAHHTVQQFLLEPPTEGSIPEFHFQLSIANIEAGETCVAYLSFSDFEMQVTIPETNSIMLTSDVPSPVAILDSASAPLGLTHIVSSAFKVRRYMRTGNTGHQLPAFDLAKFIRLKKHPPPKLQEKYLFLNYAIENWINHTSDFSEDNTTMWKAFGYLAMEKPTVFDIRTWGDGYTPNDLPHAALFRWAIGAGHVPLLRLLSELPIGSNLRDYCDREFGINELIALSALGNGHINVLEFLAREACVDIAYGRLLIEAALGGREEVVDLLLGYWLSLNKGAAGSENIAVMRVMMQDEPPLDFQVERTRAALAGAAERNLDKILTVLLDKATNFKVAATHLRGIWGGDEFRGAIERGLDGVVHLLLEKGDDIDPTNRGQTALHSVTTEGHTDVVQFFKNGATINKKDDFGWTALHWAAWQGQDALVQLLLKRGADIVARDGSGLGALHWAVNGKHQSVVQLLLEQGADIDAKDDFGRTALYRATQNGQIVLVQLLLERGADVNAKDNFGGTALHRATRNEQSVLAQMLLEWGADINARDSFGWGALHWAAIDGYQAVVRLLLKRGADINAKDDSGRTALYRATQNGQTVLVQLLLEWGADVNVKDDFGGTALHRAIRNEQSVSAQLLLERGADINIKDDSGRTALHRATRNEQSVLAQMLLEWGADINARDSFGWGALHWAVTDGYQAVVQLLLERGADINAKDKSGWTALHLAARNGRETIVRLLLERGANANAMDNSGLTALRLATTAGHEAVMQLLTPLTPDLSPIPTDRA